MFDGRWTAALEAADRLVEIAPWGRRREGRYPGQTGPAGASTGPPLETCRHCGQRGSCADIDGCLPRALLLGRAAEASAHVRKSARPAQSATLVRTPVSRCCHANLRSTRTGSGLAEGCRAHVARAHDRARLRNYRHAAHSGVNRRLAETHYLYAALAARQVCRSSECAEIQSASRLVLHLDHSRTGVLMPGCSCRMRLILGGDEHLRRDRLPHQRCPFAASARGPGLQYHNRSQGRGSPSGPAVRSTRVAPRNSQMRPWPDPLPAVADRARGPACPARIHRAAFGKKSYSPRILWFAMAGLPGARHHPSRQTAAPGRS